MTAAMGLSRSQAPLDKSNLLIELTGLLLLGRDIGSAERGCTAPGHHRLHSLAAPGAESRLREATAGRSPTSAPNRFADGSGITRPASATARRCSSCLAMMVRTARSAA